MNNMFEKSLYTGLKLDASQNSLNTIYLFMQNHNLVIFNNGDEPSNVGCENDVDVFGGDIGRLGDAFDKVARQLCQYVSQCSAWIKYMCIIHKHINVLEFLRQLSHKFTYLLQTGHIQLHKQYFDAISDTLVML